MMGDIYIGAERVIACVGYHEDDSAILLSILNKKSTLFARASETCLRFTEAPPSGEEPSQAVKLSNLEVEVSPIVRI